MINSKKRQLINTILKGFYNNINILLHWKQYKKELAERKGYCSKCWNICCNKDCPFLKDNRCIIKISTNFRGDLGILAQKINVY